MSVVAKVRYLRIAPRKVRLVADLVRGKTVQETQTILSFTIKKAAPPLLKLLNSALANAKNNFQLNPDNLYLSKILVDEGPKYKRWRARARGRADQIQKKTSHITIVLAEIKKGSQKVKKVKKIKVAEGTEKVPPAEKTQKEGKPPMGQAKLRPEKEIAKPKVEKGIKRIFRRKAF